MTNDADVDRQNRAHEENALKVAYEKKTHQTDVLRQVGERDRTMRRDLQDRMYASGFVTHLMSVAKNCLVAISS